MASCNWAFGVAIILFVVTLILILVIVLGGSDDDNEKIIVIPPAPVAGASVPAGPSKAEVAPVRQAQQVQHQQSQQVQHQQLRSEMGKIRELRSAAEALELLSSKKPALVLFYANFCGHCKKMMPDFEQAASLADSKTGIIIARVEAGALKDMNSLSGKLPAINGFPTAVSNYEGGLKTHVGRLEKQAIVKLIQKAASGVGAPLGSSSYHGGVAAYGSNSPISGHGSRSCGSPAHAASELRMEESTRAGSRKFKEFDSWQEACDALQSDKKTIVMAYADWCGFCKSMMPDYEKLLEKAPKDVTVARVNADKLKHAEVCNGKKGMIDVIKGYPTTLYNGGKLISKLVGRQSLDSLLKVLKQ